MRILVACEESQAVTIAFRNKGHEAYSCDLLPCSGGYPEWHIQGDARGQVIYSNQGIIYNKPNPMGFDLVISFPPCTDLAVSGARWFDKKRLSGEQETSIKFFFEMWFYSHVTENPIGIMNDGRYIRRWFPKLYQSLKYNGFPFKPSQIIHPWQFGHKSSKSTCLWIKDVSLLQPTKIVGPPKRYKDMHPKELKEWTTIHRCPPGPERAIIRSKTFLGIAQAMADQWG